MPPSFCEQNFNDHSKKSYDQYTPEYFVESVKHLEEVLQRRGPIWEAYTRLELLQIIVGQWLPILMDIILTGQLSQSLYPAGSVSMHVKLNLR